MLTLIKEMVLILTSPLNIAFYKDKINLLSKKRKKLIKLIQNAPEEEDQFFCRELYGTSHAIAYDKLKQRVYRNLLDIYLFSTNPEAYSQNNYDFARDRCLREFAVLRVISTKGAIHNIEYLAKQLLTNCIKYELNELVVEIIKILMNLYGTARQNSKKFNQYKELYLKFNEVRSIEDDLQIMYSEIYSNAPVLESRVDEEWLKDYDIPHLIRITNEKHSFKSTFFAHSILCLIAELNKDYIDLESYSRKAIAYISASKLGHERIIVTFLRRIFISNIKLKNYEKAIGVIKELEEITPAKSISWFGVKMYSAVLHMHQMDYHSALEVIINARANRFINSISENIKEYIYLIYAYLAFIHAAGLIQHEEFEKKQFRLYSTLNNIPLYSKDKRGANISIIIVQILFLLKDRKYDKIIDRIDALRQYSYRYLRNDDSFRSNVFIRMIIEMTKANFHPILTTTYTGKLLKKLESKPLELSEQPVELEIIPYETLWEIMMDILEKNSTIRRGRPRKATSLR